MIIRRTSEKNGIFPEQEKSPIISPDKLQSTFFSGHNFEKSCLLVEALKVDDFYKYLFDKIVFFRLTLHTTTTADTNSNMDIVQMCVL